MSETKYVVKFTTQFKKDFKLAMKRGFKMDLLEDVITLLAMGEVLLELRRKLDNVFRLAHAFKSANNSSVLVYPFTEGSFAILSASSMAAIVSLLGWFSEI